MRLTDYIKAQRGNSKALAEKLGVSLSILSQIAHDSTSTSPARCVAIEQATEGAVTRKDLRPDWRKIWPELEHTDCACQKKKSKKAKASV